MKFEDVGERLFARRQRARGIERGKGYSSVDEFDNSDGHTRMFGDKRKARLKS